MNVHHHIDYLELTELIDHYQLDITAGELHGLVTGSVCTEAFNPVEDSWLTLLMPYDALDEHQLGHLNDNLKIYYNLTQHELNSTLFEFNPALPDEDSSSEFRTHELAAWCRGFLTAYRQYLKSDERLGEDASEALNDLAEIAFAETGEGEDEDHEQALAELEEYLRVSIQIIYDDLNPPQTVH